jgi:hypothetical protein
MNSRRIVGPVYAYREKTFATFVKEVAKQCSRFYAQLKKRPRKEGSLVLWNYTVQEPFYMPHRGPSGPYVELNITVNIGYPGDLLTRRDRHEMAQLRAFQNGEVTIDASDGFPRDWLRCFEAGFRS